MQQQSWAQFAHGTFRRIGGDVAALSAIAGMAGLVVSIITAALKLIIVRYALSLASSLRSQSELLGFLGNDHF